MTRLIPPPAPPSFKVIFSKIFPRRRRHGGPVRQSRKTCHPQADGMIRLDFLSLLATPLATGVIYEAQVAAVGPGGSSASAWSNTFAFGMACPPNSISPTSNVVAAGATGSVTVTAATGCGWTATSNAAWITISAGATGTATARLRSTSPRTRGTPRTGTLTIGGNTFTVTQAGATCAPTISAPSANVWRPGDRDRHRHRRPPAAPGPRRATRRGSRSAPAPPAAATAR